MGTNHSVTIGYQSLAKAVLTLAKKELHNTRKTRECMKHRYTASLLFLNQDLLDIYVGLVPDMELEVSREIPYARQAFRELDKKNLLSRKKIGRKKK